MLEYADKRITGWDTETDLIQPGVPAPPLVCLQWDNGRDPAGLCLAGDAKSRLEREFADCDLLAAHNGAFDYGVWAEWAGSLDLVFDMFESGKVVDTMLFQRLGEIAGHTGRSSLALDMVMVKHGFPQPSKDDAIRLTFGQFLGEEDPVGLRPGSPHYNYAVDDGTHCRNLLKRQIARYGRSVRHSTLTSLTRTHFWLTLMRNRGLKVDPIRLARFRENAEEHLKELRLVAWEAGFLRVRVPTEDMKTIRDNLKKVGLWEKGLKPELTVDQLDEWMRLGCVPERTQDHIVESLETGGHDGKGCIANQKRLREAVTEAYEGAPPMTEPARNRKSKTKFVPQVSIGKVALDESGDPLLEEMSKMGEWKKAVGTDAKHLARGVLFPVSTKWGFADSGRTTSSGPNVQNPARNSGARECYTPREGFCFLDADWSSVELVTLAQFCIDKIGDWTLADRINKGMDEHSFLCSHYMGIPYEEVMRRKEISGDIVDDKRGMMKPANFGLPVGMCAATFVFFAKLSYGQKDMTLEIAEEICKVYHTANPFIKEFHKWIKRQKDSNRRYKARVPGNGILRRGATFCSLANSMFQGYAAALAEIAGWEIAKACYLGNGPLSKCFPVNFIHDQFVLECPIGMQHEAGLALQSIMENAPRRILPDVRLVAEPCAAMLWSKKAKPVKNDSGELLIWTPEEIAA